MIRTYIFDVFFTDVDKRYTQRFKIAASSFKSAFEKLKFKVVNEYSTRCVTANVNPVYELESNSLTVTRSFPVRYPSVLID